MKTKIILHIIDRIPFINGFIAGGIVTDDRFSGQRRIGIRINTDGNMSSIDFSRDEALAVIRVLATSLSMEEHREVDLKMFDQLVSENGKTTEVIKNGKKK